MDLRLESQKNNVGRRITILEIPCMPIFAVKTDNLEFFWLKFRKIAQLHIITLGVGLPTVFTSASSQFDF